MTKVTIHAAKTNLSKLIAQVEAGEEVVICRGATEVARLMPIAKPRPHELREEQADWTAPDQESKPARKPGFAKGKIVVPDTFYDPWSAKDFTPGIMDSDPEWGEPGVWDGETRRKPGSMKGQITLDDAFFDPLNDDELGLADGAEPKP